MTFSDGVLIASMIWFLAIVLTFMFAYYKGSTAYDSQLDWTNGYDEGWNAAFETNMPKQGAWINSDVCESILSKCSRCGYSLGAYTFTYCPKCGAYMKNSGGENDER